MIFMEKFLLKLIVENHRGVMARIATLLARKGYNIKSASVGKYLNKEEASIIILVEGSKEEIENAKNLLGKLISVIKIEMFNSDDLIEIENCLIKLKKAEGIEEKISQYNGKVLKENSNYVIVELVENPQKINEFVELMKEEFEIIDISRSGSNAMAI